MIGWAAIRALPWRWIGGGALVLAAVVGILIYGGGKYKAGVAAENARWQKIAAKSAAEQRAAEQRWQARLHDADTALAAARAAAGKTTEKVTHEIREYYRDRPADAVAFCCRGRNT